MAAADESRGLKIAVAAFLTLSVMLTVTSYFLYASAATAQARLDSERDARMMAKKTTELAVGQYDEIRTRVGIKAVEFDAAKAEVSANLKNVDERLGNLIDAVRAAIRTAQPNGAQVPELEEAKLKVQKAIASYRGEPNKNYTSALERMTELLESLASLTTQLSRNYAGVRKNAEETTSGVKDQKDQAPKTKDQGPTTKN